MSCTEAENPQMRLVRSAMRARIGYDFKAADLAAELEISAGYMSDILSGKRQVPAHIAKRYAKTTARNMIEAGLKNVNANRDRERRAAMQAEYDRQLFAAMKADHGADYASCGTCGKPTLKRYICRWCLSENP